MQFPNGFSTSTGLRLMCSFAVRTRLLRLFKVKLTFSIAAPCYAHGAMMNTFEIEDRLREDLENSQKRLEHAMAIFRQAAVRTDSGADQRFKLASIQQAAAREVVVETMHRLNQFFLFGTIPESLAQLAFAAKV
jgi:hypothetical protein